MSTSNEREPLDGDEVERVAQLSMLELSDEERGLFPNQLNAILDRVAEMNELDIDGVKPTGHPYGLTNIVRSDEVEVLTEVRQQALAAAPEVEDHQFRVPPALGEE